MFYPYSGEQSSDGTTSAASTCVFMVDGAVPGTTFSFDYIVHSEIIGSAVSGIVTRSDAHERGSSIMRTAYAETQADYPSAIRESSSATSYLSNLFGNALGKGLSHQTTNDLLNIGSFAQKAYAAYQGSRLRGSTPLTGRVEF